MRTLKQKYILMALAITLLASVSINLLQNLKIRELNSQPSSYNIDEPYISKAVSLWSTRIMRPQDEAMKYRYAKTMHIGDEVCVELAIKGISVGGVPVYCFDKDSYEIRRRYDEVE